MKSFGCGLVAVESKLPVGGKFRYLRLSSVSCSDFVWIVGVLFCFDSFRKFDFCSIFDVVVIAFLFLFPGQIFGRGFELYGCDIIEICSRGV